MPTLQRRRLLFSSRRAWVPADIGSPVPFWYDPSAAGIAAAQPVPSLSDLSGNGLTIAQASGPAQPTVTAFPNGRLGMLFDGGDSLARASVNLSAYGALTVVMVAGGIGNATSRDPMTFGNVTADSGSFKFNTLSPNGRFRAFCRGDVGTSVYQITAGVGDGYHVLIATFDFSKASAEALAWMDTDAVGANVVNSDNNNALTFGTLTLTIGTATPFMCGDVFAIGRVCTAPEIATIAAGEKGKWGTA